jgi:hypothetical protein
MNKHAIITRMVYEEDDPKFEERLAIYRAMCLPRLRLQKNKNFDISVLCNKKHADIFRSLGIIPHFLKEEFYGERMPVGTWILYTPWENIEGLEKYDIQTNLDSDDLVSPDYTEKIEEEMKKHNCKTLLSFQERLYNPHTFEEKEMRKKYHEKMPSAFYSLYQPDKTNYIYINHDSHLQMHKYAEKSIIVGEGYCWASIHGNNDSTTMNS